MNRILFAIFFLALIASCKSKKKVSDQPAQNFFVSDYIKGQVAMLDSLHYPFFKIENINGRSDTNTITNAEAKILARDFLVLPDISSDNLRDDYEVSKLFDDLQEAFVFTYLTKENHPVQREDITVEPGMNAKGQNDIRSMYADLRIIDNASSVRKNMLWEANKSFEITTITDLPGAAQTIKRVKVIWKGFDNLLK